MSSTTIPFELSNNHIYVQARHIKSDASLWFILDTCAGSTLIDTRRAQELGLAARPDGNFVAFGAGQGADKPAGSFVQGVELGLGNVELRFPTIAALSLAGLDSHEGRRVDGVLGYELFSRFVVAIDYVAQVIKLHDPQSYVYSGYGVSIPFQLMFGRLPLVQAGLAQDGSAAVEARLLIDSGASLALGLSRPFNEAHGLLRQARRTIPMLIGVGVGGQSKGQLARVKKLQLGSFGIEHFVGSFSHDTEGVFKLPGLDGIVGGEILRRFNVVFHYPQLRMILEPNIRFDDAYEFDASGALLMASGANFKEVRIHHLVRNSPAAEAGLREGDLLLEIDGQPASSLTLEQIRQMLKQQGRALTLRIKQSDRPEPSEAKLRLRRLI